MLGSFKRYIINIITSSTELGESLEFDGNDHSGVQDSLYMFKHLSLCKEKIYNKVKFGSSTLNMLSFFSISLESILKTF